MWRDTRTFIPSTHDHKINFKGAGEMAQWLRALTALPEDLGSIPSSQKKKKKKINFKTRPVGAHNPYNASSKEAGRSL